ncbi:MAG: right-handed parallel beta-helix repeat-containing protein, partial [Candidatus Symbiothrix sp.]|nr:right-handed parallel beta-helix repeat-containing protein [Candidatus Symbiothrix sp.]
MKSKILFAFFMMMMMAVTEANSVEYQPSSIADGVLYVKQTGTGNGSSWANAYSQLADALLAAQTNTNIKEIWVAAGTYKPLYATDGASTNPRDRAFVLVEGLKIYGGFPADANDTDHTSILTRGLAPLYDPLSNATILSGDIDGDNTLTDNAYHVVIGTNIAADGKTILDGFTITGGNADGGNSSILVNERYVFRNSGGGIHNIYSSPTLTNLTISGNTVTTGSGGGIYNNYSSSPTFTNVTISGNTAENAGGIYSNGGSPTFTNVTISGNTADVFGGGIYGGSFTLTNSTISGNTAYYSGGGVYNSVGSPTLTNVTISGNSAHYGGGGIYNGGSPALTNVTISGNIAPSGGGIYNSGGSPTLTNLTFSGNTAENGGGIYSNGGSSTFTNVTISGNRANTRGGGIHNSSSSSLKLTNSILWGNSAAAGSNVYTNGGSLTYNYSLLQDESLTGSGNLNGTLPTNDPLFASPAAASSAPTTTGNYRLKSTSPLIDKGNNGLYESTTGRVLQSDVDLDGNPRLSDASIDLGAYEFFGLIWTGLSDNKWIEPRSWNTEEIPNANLSVYIPGKLTTYPVLTEADNATVKDVRFGPGAEIGRQDLLNYEKAFVQLDFGTNGSDLERDRWYILANPLQELYAGDFSFGGYPGMDMKLFKKESPQSEKAIWKRINGLEQSFSAGDGFIVWLAPNPSGQGEKGLLLSKGILELPYLNNANVPANVHWTHHYTTSTSTSTFGGWKEDNGSIVEYGSSGAAVRHLDKAYRLAGQTVTKTLDAGQDLFAIVGNPFMGSIDFPALQAANPSVIKSTYQIWIGPGGALGGSYAGYNVSGGAFGREGVNVNNYIAPMQSFIVEKSDVDAPATLAFDLAAIGATGVQTELRSTAPPVDKLAIVASTAQAGVRTVIVSRQEGG